MTKILVTGGEGQLGREFSELDNESVCTVVRCSRQELDITDAAGIDASLDQMQPSVVVNAAAYTRVDAAESDRDAAHRINETGAGLIARACTARSLPLIHISTDYVFDGLSDTAYTESDATSPANQYGWSKLAGELAVAKRNTRHIILRTSWVFGQYGHNFVKTIMRLATESRPLRIVADQTGSPTSAAHLAAVICRIADKIADGNFAGWGIYHYCDAPAASWYEFARSIVQRAVELELIEKPVDVTPINTTDYPTPAQRPPVSVLDCSKTLDVFGIEQNAWRQKLDEVILATR